MASPKESLHEYLQRKPVKQASLLDRAKDLGIDVVQAGVGAGEGAIGIGSLATGGLSGQGWQQLKNLGISALGEKLYGPLSPEEQAALEQENMFNVARDYWANKYSEERQQEQADVSRAFREEGILSGMGEALSEPATVAGTVVQSLPLMFMGRGLATGAAKAIPALSEAAWLGHVGEGLVTAGTAIEGMRGESPTHEVTPEQLGYAGLAGLGTGLIGAASGKVANRLGIADVDIPVGLRPAEAAALAAKKSAVRRFAEGGVIEAGEEMLQSAQEQALQNIATGKPVGEGVEESIGMGGLSGFAMGGPTAAFQHKVQQIKTEAEVRKEEIRAKVEVAYAERNADIAGGKASVDLTGTSPTLDEQKTVVEQNALSEQADVAAAIIDEEAVANVEVAAQEEINHQEAHPHHHALAQEVGEDTNIVRADTDSIYQSVIKAGGKAVDFVKQMVQRFGEAAKRYALQVWSWYKQSSLSSERGSFSTKKENRVLLSPMIHRTDLKKDRSVLFLFGDNDERKGFGGQAKEMRGEANAIGVRTKSKPTLDKDAFWTDDSYEENVKKIDEDLAPAFAHVAKGGVLVIPKDGLGTGLAKLKEKAPRTDKYLKSQLNALYASGKTEVTEEQTSQKTKQRKVAVIGTAGRDKSKVFDKDTWERMLSALDENIKQEDHLVSGGAAWADHLAVKAFLDGKVSHLTLHLPAPIKDGKFVGSYGTSGGAANYYHARFKEATGIDGLAEIQEAIRLGATVTYQKENDKNYSAMKNRNAVVAKDADEAIAFTYGEDDTTPADGGTKHTWDLMAGKNRKHIPISRIGRTKATPATSIPQNLVSGVEDNSKEDLADYLSQFQVGRKERPEVVISPEPFEYEKNIEQRVENMNARAAARTAPSEDFAVAGKKQPTKRSPKTGRFGDQRWYLKKDPVTRPLSAEQTFVAGQRIRKVLHQARMISSTKLGLRQLDMFDAVLMENPDIFIVRPSDTSSPYLTGQKQLTAEDKQKLFYDLEQLIGDKSELSESDLRNAQLDKNSQDAKKAARLINDEEESIEEEDFIPLDYEEEDNEVETLLGEKKFVSTDAQYKRADIEEHELKTEESKDQRFGWIRTVENQAASFGVDDDSNAEWEERVIYANYKAIERIYLQMEKNKSLSEETYEEVYYVDGKRQTREVPVRLASIRNQIAHDLSLLAEAYNIVDVVSMIFQQEDIRSLAQLRSYPESLEEFIQWHIAQDEANTEFVFDDNENIKEAENTIAGDFLRHLRATLSRGELSKNEPAILFAIKQSKKVLEFIKQHIYLAEQTKTKPTKEFYQELAQLYRKKFGETRPSFSNVSNQKLENPQAGTTGAYLEALFSAYRKGIFDEEIASDLDTLFNEVPEGLQRAREPKNIAPAAVAKELKTKKKIKSTASTVKENKVINDNWPVFFDALHQLATSGGHIVAKRFNLKRLAEIMAAKGNEDFKTLIRAFEGYETMSPQKRTLAVKENAERIVGRMWQYSRVQFGTFEKDIYDEDLIVNLGENIQKNDEKDAMHSQDVGLHDPEEVPFKQETIEGVNRIPSFNTTGFQVHDVEYWFDVDENGNQVREFGEDGKPKTFKRAFYITNSEKEQLEQIYPDLRVVRSSNHAKEPNLIVQMFKVTKRDEDGNTIDGVWSEPFLINRITLNRTDQQFRIIGESLPKQDHVVYKGTEREEIKKIPKTALPTKETLVFDWLQTTTLDDMVEAAEGNEKELIPHEEIVKLKDLLSEFTKSRKRLQQARVELDEEAVKEEKSLQKELQRKIDPIAFQLRIALVSDSFAKNNVISVKAFLSLAASEKYAALNLTLNGVYNEFIKNGRDFYRLLRVLDIRLQNLKTDNLAKKYQLLDDLSLEERATKRFSDIVRAIVTEGFSLRETYEFNAFMEDEVSIANSLDPATRELFKIAKTYELELLNGRQNAAITAKSLNNSPIDLHDFAVVKDNNDLDPFEKKLIATDLREGRVLRIRPVIARVFYEKIAKIFGADLVVVHDPYFQSQYLVDEVSGRPKVIVNLYSGKSRFAMIFAHEMFHHIVNRVSPAEYKAFTDALKKTAAGKKSRLNLGMEETQAEVFARVFTHKKFWMHLSETFTGRQLGSKLLIRLVSSVTKIQNLILKHNFEYENLDEVYELFSDLIGQAYGSKTLQHASKRFYTSDEAAANLTELEYIRDNSQQWVKGFWAKYFPEGTRGKKAIMTGIENLVKQLIEWVKLGTKHIFAHFGADKAQADLAYEIAYSHKYEMAQKKKYLDEKFKQTFKGWTTAQKEKLHDDFIKGQFREDKEITEKLEQLEQDYADNKVTRDKYEKKKFALELKQYVLEKGPLNVGTDEGKAEARALGYSDEVIELFAYYQQEARKIYEDLKKLYPDLDYRDTHYGQSVQWYSSEGTLLDQNFDWPTRSEQSQLEGNKRYLKEINPNMSTEMLRRIYKLSYKTIDPHELFLNYFEDARKLIALKDVIAKGASVKGANGKPIIKTFATPQQAAKEGYYPVDDNALKIFAKMDMTFGYQIVKESGAPLLVKGRKEVYSTKEEAEAALQQWIEEGEMFGETRNGNVKEVEKPVQKTTGRYLIYGVRNGKRVYSQEHAFNNKESAERLLNELKAKYPNVEYGIEAEMETPKEAQVAQIYMQKDLARMINVLLAPDWLRHGSFMGVSGRSVMNVKNKQTMVEFAFSLFHLQTITQEMVASRVAHAVGQGQYGKAIKSFYPVSTYKESRELVRFIEQIIKDENAAKNPEMIKRANELLGTKNADLLEAIKYFYLVGGELDQDKGLNTSFDRLGEVHYNDLRGTIEEAYQEALAQNPNMKLLAGAKTAMFAAFKVPSDWLMRNVIPRMKAAAFLYEFTQSLEKNKHKLESGLMTKEQIARDTIWFVEDRFGEVNWMNKWMKPSMKTALQFFFRSFTWFTGSWTAFGKSAIDFIKLGWFKIKGEEYELTQKGRWAVAAILSHGLVSAVVWSMYWAWSAVGAGDDEVEQDEDLAGFTIDNFLFPRVDPFDPSARATIPSYVTELYKIFRHVGVIGNEVELNKLWTGRLNSIIGRAWEAMITGEDWQGVSITDSDDNILTGTAKTLWHIVGTLPISVSTIWRHGSEKGFSLGDTAMGFMGFTDAPAAAKRTNFHNAILAERAESFRGRKIEKEKAEGKKNLKRAMYKYGQGDSEELDKLMAEGKISEASYKRQLKKLPRINGKPNPQYEKIDLGSGVTIENVLNVWHLATDNEKELYKGEVKKKFLNMMARDTHSPEEKQKIKQRMVDLGIMR